MRIPLNAMQAQILEPYFARVRQEAVKGSPGMLVAQLSRDVEGHYWMIPAFLPHELADLISQKGQQV
jgi:hypothetical protein